MNTSSKICSLCIMGLSLTLFKGYALAEDMDIKTVREANFACDDNTTVHVLYQQLADKSFGFARLSRNNMVFTLPRIADENGAHYFDGKSAEWISAGNKGTFTSDFTKTPFTQTDCTEVKKK